MVLAGPALTVDCGPADNLMLHAALAHAQPGDVLVADARGFTDAGAWGDILTFAAQKAGIAGLVIDGAVRDADEIVTMGFPVFAKGLSIRSTSKLYKGTVGRPINIAGTVVNNGDIVVGDRDGLVVVPADELDESISLAELRERKEAEFRRKINEGLSTVELLGLTDRLRSYVPNR
jgi:4-hydroxy-4-methyl-2-oxoglutarate aldolase